MKKQESPIALLLHRVWRFFRRAVVTGHHSNQFNISPTARFSGKANVKRGESNNITIEDGVDFKGRIVIRGNNNTVLIGKHCKLNAFINIKGNNQTVHIGAETTMRDVYLLCQEGHDIHIGKRCMFSRGIEIRTSDAHALIDRESRKRINLAQSVSIGDHVWVGFDAIISKGSHVPADCIIAARSFVNKAFEEESALLAGVPADILRRGVTWNRRTRMSYKQEELDDWRV